MNENLITEIKNLRGYITILQQQIQNNPHLEFTYDDLGHTIMFCLLAGNLDLEELVDGMNSALLDHNIDKIIRIYDKYSDE